MKASEDYGILPKAPIIEAVINIQCQPVGSLDLVEKFSLEIAEEFPTKKNFYEITAKTTFSKEITTDATRTHTGFRLVSKDEKNVIVAKTNGLIFSRLNPYTHWEELKNGAKKYWVIYNDLLKPKIIDRLAIRYINQIDMAKAEDLKQYLQLNPKFPELIGNADNFFLRLVAPQNEIGATLILTEAQTESTSEEKKSFILDIDLFREQQSITNENEIWKTLDLFRDRKNDIFFNAITPEYKERLKNERG